MKQVDISLITVIPDEYRALTARLAEHGCSLTADPGTAKYPNIYGWQTGLIRDSLDRTFSIVVAFSARPGTNEMTSAVSETLLRFKPRYVVLLGIAGGFSLDGLQKGDVAISSVIYDYEYGKTGGSGFKPRMDFVYQIDTALLTSVIRVSGEHSEWKFWKGSRAIGEGGLSPKALCGAIASGNKVIDDATDSFFKKVLNAWPKLLAVEMEGAGAAKAIETARTKGMSVGFIMIRGISDMPNLSTDKPPVQQNSAERDTWKQHAATVAANLVVFWIKNGWPAPPRAKKSKASPLANDAKIANEQMIVFNRSAFRNPCMAEFWLTEQRTTTSPSTTARTSIRTRSGTCARSSSRAGSWSPTRPACAS